MKIYPKVTIERWYRVFLKHYLSLFLLLLLPSATKLWQGNIFTGVCQSFCSWGVSAPVHAGIHISPAKCMLGYIPLPSACWDTPPAQCMLGYNPHPVHASIHTHPCPVQAGIHTPRQTPPWADNVPPMATAADGTHRTGMQSCFVVFSKEKLFLIDINTFYRAS